MRLRSPKISGENEIETRRNGRVAACEWTRRDAQTRVFLGCHRRRARLIVTLSFAQNVTAQSWEKRQESPRVHSPFWNA
jgi:hypothetical protein